MSTDGHNAADRKVPRITEGLESINDFGKYSEGDQITVATNEERVSGQVIRNRKTDNYRTIHIDADDYEGNPVPRAIESEIDGKLTIHRVNWGPDDEARFNSDEHTVDEMRLSMLGNYELRVTATVICTDGFYGEWPFGRVRDDEADSDDSADETEPDYEPGETRRVLDT